MQVVGHPDGGHAYVALAEALRAGGSPDRGRSLLEPVLAAAGDRDRAAEHARATRPLVDRLAETLDDQRLAAGLRAFEPPPQA